MLNKLNKVLILGCGTIGRIKSRLWLSLGMDVYLHDTSPSQVGKLLKTDVRLKSPTQTRLGDCTFHEWTVER